MIGNPINFDKKYFSKNRLWNKPNLDVHIKRYLKCIRFRNWRRSQFHCFVRTRISCNWC